MHFDVATDSKRASLERQRSRTAVRSSSRALSNSSSTTLPRRRRATPPPATATTCAVLWEDEPCTASQRSYCQSLVADLRATLEGAGTGGALAKSWNSLAFDPEALDCGSYRFLDGDPEAVNSYRGAYPPSYSWAEFSTGPFRSRLR